MPHTCIGILLRLGSRRNIVRVRSPLCTQVDEVWLTTVMAVTRICHEPNGHLRNHAALVLTGCVCSLSQWARIPRSLVVRP